MFLADKLQRILAEFAMLEDPQERLSTLVDRARRTPALSPVERNDANRVRGCVSVVWLVGERREERCYFRSDAESPIVRGLVAFVCEFFSGAPAAEITTWTSDPLEALGVLRNLSPTRRNGLAAAQLAIRTFARQALAK